MDQSTEQVAPAPPAKDRSAPWFPLIGKMAEGLALKR
jgi:hypothetical protein